jgi:hypothetical protein
VTAVDDDDLLQISFPNTSVDLAGNGSLHTQPATYTERQDVEHTVYGDLAGFTKDNSAAGATGSVSSTFTVSSGTFDSAAYLVRIPSATPAGGGSAPRTLATTGVGK